MTKKTTTVKVTKKATTKKQDVSKTEASTKKKRGVDYKVLTLRLTPEELNELKAKATDYFKGNMSGWIRYTSLNYKPTKKELKKVAAING